MRKMTISDETLTKILLHSPESFSKTNQKNLVDLYNEKGESWMLDKLKNQKIVPFGAHILSNAKCDPDFWEDIHIKYEKRNSQISKALEEVFYEFDKKQVSICVYENFGVILRSKSCLGCFTSGDVDLTARSEDKIKIDKIFEEYGFKEISRRSTNSSKVMTAYFNPNKLDNGLWINVSWQPIARRFVLHNKKLSNRLNVARHSASYVSDYHIKVLNTDELMYYSILHIALGHYYTISPRFRLYVDVDRLARNCEINWDNIFKWSREDNMGIRVGTVLSICKDLLDTPVPDNEVSLMSQSKYSKKLMNYLYNQSKKEYYERDGRFERIYIDLISDGVHPFKAIINRVFNVRTMEGL